jgi:lysozyme
MKLTEHRALSLCAALLMVACAPNLDSSKTAPADTDVEASPEAVGGEESDASPTEPADAPTDEATPEPEVQGDPITGIDVSHVQGTVDWAKVKAAGVSFAFAKASEGETYVDPQFSANWNGMKDAGIVRGAYAFFVAGEDPTKQATHFLAQLQLESGDLPPVVNIETKGSSTETDATLVANLKTYLNVIEKATGGKPMIYTGAAFWNAHGDESFGDYPLWVAEYEVEEPKVPKGWDGWTFWQHTQAGKTDGVEGDVDQDNFAEPLNSLKGLALP